MSWKKDLDALRADLDGVTQDEASKRASAQKVEADIRAANGGLVPAEQFETVDAAYKDADGLRDKAADLALREQGILRRIAAESGRTPAGIVRTPEETGDRRSFAGRVAGHETVEGMRARYNRSANTPLGTSEPIEDVLTREEVRNGRFRTVSSWFDTTDASGLRKPDYLSTIVEQLVQRVTLLDLLPTGTTDTDVVTWTVESPRSETSVVPAAYGTAAGIAQYAFTRDQTTVKRIPGMVVSDKGTLADAGQTESLLNQRLLNVLRRVTEGQVWSGNNTGDNLKGITGYSANFNTYNAAGVSKFDAIHKAITTQRVQTLLNLDPTVLLISVNDYEALILEKDDLGRYLISDPTANVTRPIWGLVPVVSPLISDGSPYVLDPRELGTLFLRSGVSVSVTDQHEDFFARGLVGWLAELRLALAVMQPKAVTAVSNFNA